MLKSLLLAAAALGTAGSAAAQQTPPPPNPPPYIAPPPMTVAQDRMRFQELELKSTLASQVAQEARRAGLERAQTAADLVNAGRCHDAHAQALAWNDIALANRVAAVCRGED